MSNSCESKRLGSVWRRGQRARAAVAVARQGADVMFTQFHKQRCVLVFRFPSAPRAALKKSEWGKKKEEKSHIKVVCRL